MDTQMISRAIHGDDEALIEYLKSISDQLLKTSMAFLGDRDMAKDCIAETIEKVYKHRKKVKQPAFFKTWIIKILINECKNELKRSQKYVALPEDFDIPQPIEENYEFVRDMMEKLPFDLKQILVMKFFNQMTFREISVVLNIPESTIKSRYTLALRKMRVELEETYA